MLFHHRPQLARVDAALAGLGKNLFQPHADQFHALLPAPLARAGGDRQAGAADGGEHAVVLQLAVGPGHGVRVDRQFAGQFADGGHQFALLEHVAGDREFHLADDLVVDGQRIGEVDLEEHVLSSVLAI